MNRTLDDMARSLMIDGNLPASFWPEAIQTAAYIRNRCPTSTNKFKIPFELCNGQKPEYDQLVRFGSIAYALKLPNGGKFDPKSERMIFVGYADNAKAYKLYDTSSKKIVLSRDVEFVEEKSQLPEATETIIEFNENDYVTLKERLTDSESSNETEVNTNSEPEHVEEIVARPTEPSEESRPTELKPSNENSSEPTNTIPAGTRMTMSNKELEVFTQNNPGVRLARTQGRPELVKGQCGPPVKRYHYMLNSIQVEPVSYKEALQSDDCESWQSSMREEYLSHIENETWSLVAKPEDKKILSMRWVFKVKTDEDGNVEKFKSRLCVKGCAQKFGVDYEETFAPVIRYSGIRFLLAIAIERELVAHHIDIKTAYLNSEVDEDIYVYQPEGFVMKGKENLVCKLNKAVYGLKQGARQWNLKLNEILKSMDFASSSSEPCIFMHNQNYNLMVGVYVDDLVVIGKKKDVIEFKKEIAKKLKISDKGRLKFCLSMQVDWQKNGQQLKISQQKFVSELLEKMNMSNCKPRATPVATGTLFKKAEQSEIIDEISGFQSLVGSLLYLSNCTRPDITFVVSKLCQFISAPSSEHLTIAKGVLRYLKGTMTHGLTYRKSSLECNVYADADFGNDSNDGKSTSGVMTFIGKNLIDWQSSKQSLVALSTCESEITAIVEGTRSAV